MPSLIARAILQILKATQLSFGLPETASASDIVINEILFNPRPTGVDFVEIVNISNKFINLKNWFIANVENDSAYNAKPISTEDLLINPGAYLVLTEKPTVLEGEYPQSMEKNVLAVNELPAFNDDAGGVGIVDHQKTVIDHFGYTSNMHSVFINEEEGVSLERISFNRPSGETQNWKSASSNVGYATPGYLNSNSNPEPSVTEESVKIEPEVFIPVSGQPDFTQIRYKFDHGGYAANVRVYTDHGILIKQIANNELLGTEGVLRWDGDRDDGHKARTGYYMILFEVFDDSGVVKTIRKRIAIASNF